MSSLNNQALLPVVVALTEDTSHTHYVASLSSAFSQSSYPSPDPSLSSSRASLGHHPLSQFATTSLTSVHSDHCPFPDCTVKVPHTYMAGNENTLRPDGVPSLNVQRFDWDDDPFPWVTCWKVTGEPPFKPSTGKRVYLYGFGVVSLKETGVRSGDWVVFSCKDGSGLIVTRVAFWSPMGVSRLWGSCVSNVNFNCSV